MIDVLHYAGHFVAPFLIAALICRTRRLRFALLMVAANAIDIDHVVADPVFDPNRCSIGFHPLHSLWAALGYGLMLLVPRWWVRALGAGALWHLVVDWSDCLTMG